ncbi:inositol hexakisphosphate and diphosphoinositol-pentakisphosphate kinase isoform X4 [Hermetia illucens]|uniref:inositol hexakisphosphate and diphosphoinositol-pentakisphosphate kinase isoform X4 n=1 Tax=Hermetia illucens TaxID=343691 RepID=UPI0018CC4A78|nr:inositol hexakisphosphate and diphosphoinositol-pentakisphosphate kinase isoform X4 [Hermetia illucens]
MMEWTWLKDWWRLKRLRNRNTILDGCTRDNGDDGEAENDDGNEEDDENEMCFCDDCINGDIDVCGDNNDGMDSDCSVSSNSGKQVIVGICAMAKKSQSKPMKEILTRLQEFEYIKMVVFEEDVILKEPVENWPICDCLVSFHSKGFPLEKAIQYAQLRKPYVINNLHMQYDIQDRRKVYAILESEGIEIPRYAVLDRDSPDPKQHELVESEDHVEVNGVTFNKPFVEKPVSAEDHNIYIYYPTSAGGGSQRLFRKIGSRSSVYSPESRVRKTGSFIYEDFMPTDGTDVKVYTVGPDYAHAEARKSPALDGKVERDSEGKEIRYPVILSNAEKLISRKVCLAFKQTVCGFDLLRANGKSYVCDVNGFSFVKNSNKYYDDCAKILGNMILRELTPTLHIPWSVPFQLDDPPIVPTTFGKMMELRCVVAVIRHGDRTPKQKMKVEVRHPKFFEIFEKYDGYKHGHVKLKRPKQLQEILDIARSLLAEIQTKAADSEIEEKQGKLEQLKSVLEMYGHFSGINRKVQMKYQPKGRPRGSSSDDGNNISSNAPKDPSLVLILKWGGELTPAGRIQAEELGRIFRCMYPGGQGRHDYSGTQGLGLLRLHSTFRHDLKIYASDEGRVQMTAAAFAKGLLALEGELTPILVQMVKSANTNGLLDNDCDSSKYQNMAKNRLHELMQVDRDFTVEDREAINPTNSISINQALDFVKNPVKCCAHVQSLIQSLLAVIAIKKEDPKTKDAILYHGETWDLMGRRWEKIEKDFSTKSKTFDISKIPDIYDCIKYDLQHNQHTLQYEQAEELYIYAKYLADIVIPQEYGLTVQEKLTIGQGICTPLLKKIKADLQRNIEEAGNESVNRLNPRYSHGVSSPGRHVRTRLYFTSESHVHSLLTVLRFGGLLNVLTDEQWRRAMEYISMVSELNYMSQIVIMLYEDPTKDPCSEERFHVELHFSPGVNCCVQKNLPPGPGFRPHSRNDSGQSKNVSQEENNPTRIDEENDINLEESPPGNSKNPSEQASSPEETSEVGALPKNTRPKHLKTSKPIPIGSHHTVCGHEAMDLAKRLSEELAAQQAKQSGSLGTNRALSPDAEPRSRSYEQQHPKTKENKPIDYDITNVLCSINRDHFRNISSCNNISINVTSSTPLYQIDSATNELPLSAIDFSINPLTPETMISDPLEHSISPIYIHENEPRTHMSPLATNERPLSCTCLNILVSEQDNATTAVCDLSASPIPTDFCNPVPIFSLNDSFIFSGKRHSCPELYVGPYLFCSQVSQNGDTITYSADIFQTCCSAPAALTVESSLTDQFPLSSGDHDPASSSLDDNNTLHSSNSKLVPIDSDDSCNRNSSLNSNNIVKSSVTSLETITSQSQFANVDTMTTSSCINPSSPCPSSNLKLIKSNGDSTSSLCSSTISAYPDSPHVPSASRKIRVTITKSNPTPFTSETQLSPSPVIGSPTMAAFLTPTVPLSFSCTNFNPINPHPKNDKIHNPDTTTSSASSSASASARRQRHSIAGQMSYFKMLGFGGFGKKMATSTNSLFSTAVISGSSSAPNLRDMIPSTATPSGFGGVPPIRPLETLHNALSLKQLDSFLEKMTVAPLFKTPASSPPKYPSTPVPTPTQTPQGSTNDRAGPSFSWSGQSSMASSIGYLSSTEPSSPTGGDKNSRICSSSDMSASVASTEGIGVVLSAAEELSKYFPKLDSDLNAVGTGIESEHLESEVFTLKDSEQESVRSITPISMSSEVSTPLATKGSTTAADLTTDDDEEATLSVDTCLSLPVSDKHPDTPATPSPTPSLPSMSTNRVQKQISLYESELVSAHEFKSIVLPKKLPDYRKKFYATDSSSLSQSSSNDNISFAKFSIPSATGTSSAKTKSCMNLKSFSSAGANQHHPGAVVVKEKFIDLPKRVTSNYRGHTRCGSADEKRLLQNAQMSRTSDLVGSLSNHGSIRSRFVATKVTEGVADNK